MKQAAYTLYFKTILFGFRILQRLGMVHLYQPLPQANIRLNNKGQEDKVLSRWTAMKEALPEGQLSAMDIGCNSGYYCFKLAEMGHFVVGVEDSPPFHFLSFHAKEAVGINQLAFAKMLVDPENVRTLPQVDCTVLLAVFHHWCRAFGSEKALEMLDVVYEKTNKVLFFETGEGGKKYKPHLPDMGDSPEQWMIELFESKGCRKAVSIKPPGKGRQLIAVYKD